MMDESLKNSIEKLKKNRESVPLRVLRTKYAKPFNALLSSISSGINTMIRDFCFDNLVFECMEDKQVFMQAAKAIVDSPEVHKKLQESAYVDMDYNEVISVIADDIAARVNKAYMSYWTSHCKKREDGKIYNSLIDSVWNSECEVWEDNKGGFYSMFAI